MIKEATVWLFSPPGLFLVARWKLRGEPYAQLSGRKITLTRCSKYFYEVSLWFFHIMDKKTDQQSTYKRNGKFWVNLRIINPGESLSESLENSSKQVRVWQACIWCWWRGICNQAHILVAGHCYPWRPPLVDGFSALPRVGWSSVTQETRFHKISWKYLNYLRASSVKFL